MSLYLYFGIEEKFELSNRKNINTLDQIISMVQPRVIKNDYS